MFIQQTLNTVIQVMLFSFIPLIWWLCTARKKESFWSWIGLKKVRARDGKRFFLLAAGVCVFSYALGEAALGLRGELEAADSAYKGMGAAAIPSILMYAFGQTGLSEEILFRGFLMKRLQAKWGFGAAAAVQAAIFGLLHILMVWGQVGLIAGAVIVIYPMAIAVLLSWINEKKAGGSILPSWVIHGTLNTVSGILQAMM